MAMIYLGGAIDMATAKERTNWREDLKKALHGMYGHSSFDPASAFRVDLADHKTTKHLTEINKYAMGKCDIAIFVMNDKTPSIGTPMELYMATNEMSGFGYNMIEHLVIWNPHDTHALPKYSKYKINQERKRDHLDDELPAYISGMTSNVVSSFRDAILFIDHVASGNPASDFFKKEMMPPCPPMCGPVEEVEAPFPEWLSEDDGHAD